MIRQRLRFGDYELIAMQVLLDTYATFNYLLCRRGLAILIDAGEANPILHVLDQEKLQLLEILITHNHPDHIGGCRQIQDRLGVLSRSPGVESGVFDILGTPCRSLSTPGHMAIGKSYYFEELGVLFSGDTIINGGCGRMMGGTAQQYFESLQLLKSLPGETMVFGGHDYLEENLRFGLSIEPENADIVERLDRYRSYPADSVFATLSEEMETNVFLRAGTAEEFAALRGRKDRF